MMISPIGSKALVRKKDFMIAYGCDKKSTLNRAGVTFLEMMTALVILGVGITGIYRSFLQSLNYQQNLLTRLLILNFLSDQVARDENYLLQGMQLPLGSLGNADAAILAQGEFLAFREISSIDRLSPSKVKSLSLGVSWVKYRKKQLFSQSTFVYVEK
ncbi:MAG TPA: prepilin-type N-terminal cleavage/methylation domain-containing protein [Candidatus Bathyarchaeia archaeon]|nr:prepilin-type N-terminal cleavage/methylation domain-containing protein [Candidatus Bathyarchaeia archaeon]